MQRMAIVIVFLMGSCSRTQYNVRVKAPINDEFAGIISRCVGKASVEQVVIENNLSYRVISEKDNLFEIYGLEKDDLQKRFQKITNKAKFIQNKFVYPEFSIDQLKSFSFSYGPWSINDFYDEFHHLKQIAKDSIPEKYNGKNVTIAVLDTGMALSHVDLQSQLKLNEKENVMNGLDDDGNGYVDDFQGWDFVNWDNHPQDDHGHGTHVAGLAAGKIGGVATGARILPVKVMNYNGSGDMATIIAGIRYSIDRGVDIINLSLGGTFVMPAELNQLINEVQRGADRDVLIVAAAGNGGGDNIGDCNEDDHHYPSDISNDNVLSVTSINEHDELSTFANFGPVSVDLAAPGDSAVGGLLATSLGGYDEFNAYERMRGTSMAAPIVAGAAAILKQRSPSLRAQEIIEIILLNVDKTDELSSLLKSGGKLNLAKAFQSLK